jgi:hypothetical protein
VNVQQDVPIKPKRRRASVLLIVGILVIGIVIFIIYSRGGGSVTSNGNSSTVSCGSYASATPQSVLAAFQSNQAAANSQWLQKTICFTDYVGSVDENSAGQYLSCISYSQSQYGCNDQLNTYSGWVIYYWATAQVAASVPPRGHYFTATCIVNAYEGYGSFSSFGYKALILNACQLLT